MKDPKSLFIQCLAIVIAFGASILIYNKMTEPKSYEDCMLKEVKSVTTERGVTAVAQSCRQKFPKKSWTFEDFTGNKSE